MINQEEYEKIKLLPGYDWNWIAREKTGKILSFTNKPIKTGEVWKDKQTRLWFNYKDSQLFQFIQWEDEEPYRISDLIKEYDKNQAYEIFNRQFESLCEIIESEEKEVKNIEWLKEEIGELPCVDTVFNSDGSSYIDSAVPVMAVYDLIDKLDEPEVTLNRAFEKVSEIYPMTKGEVCRHLERVVAHGGKVTYGEQEVLSQEWIDEHAVAVTYDGIPDETEIVYVDELENLLVPKQEELESKIQELIEVYKQEEDAYSNPENGWIGGFIEDLKNLVADEPKYYALIKGHELTDSPFRYWNFDVLDNYLFVSNRVFKHGRFLTKTSKSEWNKLGINDSNADFVKVEEAEEW